MMTQEELTRYAQTSQQNLNAAMAREKVAEMELEEARTNRQRREGELGVLIALLERANRPAQEGTDNGQVYH
jgi:hypothetical protein